MNGKSVVSQPNDRASIRTAHFNFHGIKLRCVSTLSRPLDLLRDRLAPYVSESFSNPDLFFTFNSEVYGNPWRIQHMKPELRWIRSHPFWGELISDRLRLTDEKSIALIEYKKAHAFFRMSEETFTDSHFAARTFLLLPLIELLRTKGLFYLHGSLVSSPERSILFLGPGGSGKSTTAASFLLNGWKLVGDDNLLLTVDSNDNPTLLPLEQELSLSHEFASSLSSAKEPSMETKKVRFQLKDHPQWKADHANPTDIVMLEPERTSQTECKPCHLMEHLIRENPMAPAYPPLAKDHLRAFKALIQRTRLHRMTTPRISPDNLKTLPPFILNKLSV